METTIHVNNVAHEEWGGKCLKCGYPFNTIFTVSAESKFKVTSHGEVLRKTCPECGYTWDEKCVDAAVKDK